MCSCPPYFPPALLCRVSAQTPHLARYSVVRPQVHPPDHRGENARGTLSPRQSHPRPSGSDVHHNRLDWIGLDWIGNKHFDNVHSHQSRAREGGVGGEKPIQSSALLVDEEGANGNHSTRTAGDSNTPVGTLVLYCHSTALEEMPPLLNSFSVSRRRFSCERVPCVFIGQGDLASRPYRSLLPLRST